MTERAIMAGFGGQGMMLLGKMLAHAGMIDGLEVTFFPSYGAEVRGGTAHCHVILSDAPIYSPIVEHADTLVLMNQPSYEKFRPRLRNGGHLLLNTSMVDADRDTAHEQAAKTVLLPATEEANALGNVRVANVMMLGAYVTLWHPVSEDAIMAVLEEKLGSRKAHLLEVNRRAFRRGAELAAPYA